MRVLEAPVPSNWRTFHTEISVLKLKPIIAWATCLLLASSGAFAGSKGAMNNGLMEIGVTFLYPPTPAQLAQVKGQIQRASQILCDATDGQIRIKKAWLAEGGGAQDQGDIWIWPQDGRSGVSFYFSGAGLGTSGTHIDLFQGGIRADIIAHELGHLAFGLGDQYDEQSRWGGPCGIGPGFDSGWNEQSHSIMQQIGGQMCAVPDPAAPGLFMAAGGGCFTDADCAGGQSCQPVLMSELDVSSNFDPLRGDNNGCKAGCGDTDCAANWNSGTSRFEATQQFLIHGKSDWQTLKDNYPFVTVPAGLPTALAPAVCNTAVEFDDRVVGTDQVMLIIDTSGSMSAPVAPGATETRMDYAKAAARAFVNLQGASTPVSQVGMIHFSTTPTLDRHLMNLTSAEISGFISSEIDPLSPGGNTAIGDALLSTQFEFQGVATAGRVRTAFLLSDGENNTGSNPRDAAQSLKNQGVRVFTIPVGAEADRSLMTDIAGTTGGSMLEASGGQPLPAIYVELAAKIQGYPLIKPRGVQSARPPIITKRGEKAKRALETSFDVSAGSTELVLMLSSKEQSVANWRPRIYMIEPDGTYRSESSLKVTVDPYFRLIRIIAPKVGTWRFGVESGTNQTIQSYLVMYEKNPNAKCLAGVTKFVVNSGEKATILAGAHYGSEIWSGVNFSGEVVAPNGTVTPLTLKRNSQTGIVSADFNGFSGRGIYSVNIVCNVAAGAQQFPGEKTTGPARVMPAVPKFSATATTYFFYKTPTFPTCVDESDKGDCDGDGIPNGREPDGDLDGDGLPNRYDSDANGDDIPDIKQGVNGAFVLPPWYKPPNEMYPTTMSTNTPAPTQTTRPSSGSSLMASPYMKAILAVALVAVFGVVLD